MINWSLLILVNVSFPHWLPPYRKSDQVEAVWWLLINKKRVVQWPQCSAQWVLTLFCPVCQSSSLCSMWHCCYRFLMTTQNYAPTPYHVLCWQPLLCGIFSRWLNRFCWCCNAYKNSVDTFSMRASPLVSLATELPDLRIFLWQSFNEAVIDTFWAENCKMLNCYWFASGTNRTGDNDR